MSEEKNETPRTGPKGLIERTDELNRQLSRHGRGPVPHFKSQKTNEKRHTGGRVGTDGTVWRE